MKNYDVEEEALPLNQAVKKLLKKPFVCTMCGYRADKACHVRRHLRKGHKKLDQTNQELDVFVENKLKSQLSVEDLVEEEKQYDRKLSEEVSKKRYECDICGNKYAFISGLTQHMRQFHHMSDTIVKAVRKEKQVFDNYVKPKPKLHAKCGFPGCQRVFISRITASAHFRNVHKNRDTKRGYVCEYPGCGYRSSLKYRFLKHDRSLERPSVRMRLPGVRPSLQNQRQSDTSRQRVSRWQHLPLPSRWRSDVR